MLATLAAAVRWLFDVALGIGVFALIIGVFCAAGVVIEWVSTRYEQWMSRP